MPKIAVVFYQEDAKTVPVLDWLDRLPAKAQDKCRVRVERLRDLGHELAAPRRITCGTVFMSCVWGFGARIIACSISFMDGLLWFLSTE